MTALQLNCREFADFLMAYLDDELPHEERESFESHMQLCPPCVVYVRNYQRTIELGKDACGGDPDGPVPEDVPEKLVQAILAARARS